MRSLPIPDQLSGDPVLGGATAFVNLGVAAFPTPGSLILWNNLLSDGEPNPRTLHAGCPTVRGVKWGQWMGGGGGGQFQPDGTFSVARVQFLPEHVFFFFHFTVKHITFFLALLLRH